jgi:hypothetical protein
MQRRCVQVPYRSLRSESVLELMLNIEQPDTHRRGKQRDRQVDQRHMKGWGRHECIDGE